VRADAVTSPNRLPVVLRGATAIAEQAARFARRAPHARQGLVDGHIGVLVGSQPTPAVVLSFALLGSAIAGIDVIADPRRIDRLRLSPLPDAWRNYRETI